MGFEPTASLVLNQSGLPVAYRADFLEGLETGGFLVHLGLLWVVLEFSEKRTLEKRDGRQRTLPTHS